MAAQAIRESNGRAIAVSDQEILQAQKRIARQTGLLVEPAAAASLAGYLKLDAGENDEPGGVLLMMTGNGLKDAASLERWNAAPGARSSEEWRKR